MRRKLLIAHLLIGLQVLLAIGYYTWRDDPLDERFAWRMFSTNRTAKCGVSFRIGQSDEPVRLEKHFHQAWASMARRGRRAVLSRMAGRLCDDNPGIPIKLLARCNLVGSKFTIANGRKNLCRAERRASGEL